MKELSINVKLKVFLISIQTVPAISQTLETAFYFPFNVTLQNLSFKINACLGQE